MVNKTALFFSLCACTAAGWGNAAKASASPATQGTQSEQVLELQERLSSIGYLKARLTGFYGSGTAEAVRRFQKDNRLSPDGEADRETVDKLKQKSVLPKNGALEHLAKIIYAEARGESYTGQVAIGAVVLNRVQSPLFPDSIPEVILQPRQFSAVEDGQFGLTPDKTAYQAAKDALNGVDPTNGALFYYNPKLTSSAWSMARPKLKSIGNHIFTR
ncbi:cell wall hydrolase [Paenibacillus filicis]|uniref:Cell wall hydrolase n=1 Tax=Paenibacillus gyeongsangnamensis TaxID=3388067 RepID=A0ABT4Q5W2_9BACL|nr:cell wall hydrolase [Paenibacillus filicis]MCZ8512252.1 cell wall hydrolase [Paenibacillus filicis]